MSDFLEQVIAERRADALAAEESAPEIDLSLAKDNLWARAVKNGASDRFAGPWSSARDTVPVPVRHGDAFTAELLRARRERRLAVIAEVKRVSPALGVIAADIDPATRARQYVSAGAIAISVLTEPRHWGGSLRDLAAVREAVPYVPILCKDVIVHERQIIDARMAGADAILLIAEALTDDALRRLIVEANTLNMGVLLEAHEPVAFGRAVALHTPVVGVNARDLRRPKEIDIGRVRQLHSFARAGQVLVAESGITTVDDARLMPARVDAVLVGTALMRADDPRPLIRELSSIRRGPVRHEVEVRP
ncbi:MAG TPA: indole-3-glycerol-phosphate synthase [Candidatus Limnocylindria bacterium]|jgi:indole-3-glycerol phosphate synthase|nr:indole-3-glycerol-phosphate synthase [Candidatus Limnocylindria bacterium]